MITLKVRPRWKRITHGPRLIALYRRAGCGWWLSVRMTWAAIVYIGRWTTEPESTDSGQKMAPRHRLETLNSLDLT